MNIITRSPDTLHDGGSGSEMNGLYEEEPHAIFINGRYLSTVLLAPGDPEEYILGFLLTEQYISTIGEVESVRTEKNRISVLTTNIFTSPGPKKTILSGCGGVVSYIDPAKLPIITGDYALGFGELDRAVRKVFHTAHDRAPGPVTAYLCARSGLLLQRSDIGDDQVIDRLIGGALKEIIDLSTSYCLYSGTITSETIRKCLVSGIPLILTTGELTGLAVDIGEKSGICIGRIRDDDLILYTHPERISS